MYLVLCCIPYSCFIKIIRLIICGFILVLSTSYLAVIDPMNPESLLQLAQMTMPFGKYKGRLLMDLPEPYLVWFSNKGFPEGKLGELLALLHEMKVNGLETLLEPLRKRPR